MEQFIEFVQNWGYLAVFFGSLVEGESVILTASFMAHQGYLSLYKIMIIAFLGTLFADQTLYYVGRYYGPGLIQRHPRWYKPANRAFALLHKWDIGFILTFRFVYGIRTISPIVIGTSGIPPRRFIPLNFIAAVIWTVISCIGGYMLGDLIEEVIENFHLIKKYFVYITIGFFAIVAALIIWWWRHHKKHGLEEINYLPFPIEGMKHHASVKVNSENAGSGET